MVLHIIYNFKLTKILFQINKNIDIKDGDIDEDDLVVWSKSNV